MIAFVVGTPASGMSGKQFEPTAYCYECGKAVFWLAPDGRCSLCTRCTPEEITGGAA